MSLFIVWMIPITVLLIFDLSSLIAASSSDEDCKECHYFAKSFQEGIKRTEKEYYGKSKSGEARFYDIMEQPCNSESEFIAALSK
ncbi:hypothetical protein DdX_22378 [Ditylenchus destructor]|uniref:Uncharacterized protein n=1 Tax=Ditylenchus destructor TaxID=166010 RepID=A0AAD4MDN1_9BILA|nr:hypothetical protein DdX_22378 [Ditylenchus destructor]